MSPSSDSSSPSVLFPSSISSISSIHPRSTSAHLPPLDLCLFLCLSLSLSPVSVLCLSQCFLYACCVPSPVSTYVSCSCSCSCLVRVSALWIRSVPCNCNSNIIGSWNVVRSRGSEFEVRK
ncbi:hypothetical protein GY45DRAFT_296067 [Cubamyces sp. BRFM 1775]|nr:hypothetical protein GY45DRAFT_296067 [Cubamyces sp. BRFM 1775]